MTTGSAISISALSSQLEVGDVLFLRVVPRVFRKVAEATGTWTNHVGIVVEFEGGHAVVAESRIPLSRLTRLPAFVRRSEQGRVAVMRLTTPLSKDQCGRLRAAARRRLNILYDTGFNLHSRRQFCSRFVREVIGEATDISVGQVETFAGLLSRRPQTDLAFWKLWYFGRIPWTRETVSPASLLGSQQLRTVFDGFSSD
ncbi:MAG TPA: YebB family permuted papain-like enzyme [Steroidobacteraceae bacterium]|nr:YebB family permuted papain-like enzyme [Steroidobacteraceae bacterium]